MKTSITTAAFLSLVASQASAHLLYEGFSYADGSNLSSYSGTTNVGQVNPFGATWQSAGPTAATDFIQVKSAGLTGPGALGGTGNSAQWGGDGSAGGVASRIPIGPFFTPANGATRSIYYSATVQITNYANLWDQGTSGATVAGLNNRGLMMGLNTVGATQIGVPSIAGARLFVRKGTAPNTFQFGFSKNSVNAAETAWETTDRPLVDGSGNPVTYFVVGNYTLKNRAITNDDDAAIWINPDVSTFSAMPPQPTFSTNSLGTGIYRPTSDGNDLSTNYIQSFLLMQKGQVGQASGQIVDEIRVDTRWSGVTPVAGTTYSSTSPGTWSAGSKWSGGTAPNGVGAVVNLPYHPFNQTLTITLDDARTVGTLNLASPVSTYGYAIGGTGSLTLSGDSTLNVTYGSHSISAAVTVGTSLNVNLATGSKLTVSSDMTFAPGATLTKAGAGTLEMKNLRADAVSIIGQDSTVKITPNGTNAGVSVVRALSIPTPTTSTDVVLPPVSKLDLTDNTLIYDYTGASPLTTAAADGSCPGVITYVNTSGVTVIGLFNYGYNSGAWTGTGVVSSTAATDPKKVTSIGYAEASVLKGLSAGQTATFAGQPVDDTTLILKVTQYGDVNLDGKIDGDDYAILDRNFAKGTFATGMSARWTDGDFNYDFRVTAADYALIDKALAVQQGALSPDFLAQREAQFGDAYVAELAAAVPEPTSLGLLGLFGCLAVRPCRSRNSNRPGTVSPQPCAKSC